MSGDRAERADASVERVLRLLAERLEQYLEGDELALETLGETFDQQHIGPDSIQSAVLMLRSLAGSFGMDGEAALESEPGIRAERVLSAEERDTVSPEAFGLLLDLKRRGSLSPAQLERVLEWLGGCGVRPVGADLALEIATRVALGDPVETADTAAAGDGDRAH